MLTFMRLLYNRLQYSFAKHRERAYRSFFSDFFHYIKMLQFSYYMTTNNNNN